MTIKDTIADEFNEFSKNYTEDMERCVPYYRVLLDDFSKNLPNTFTAKTILDLGCGNGNVVNSIVEFFPKAHYTLVDASKEMLDLCKQRFSAYHINFTQSYFNTLKLKSNAYDFVVAGFSLHHCLANEKEEFYKTIFDSLKSGGVFACSDLMINKQHDEHHTHLKHWKNFVAKNYPDQQKWEWLMDHYNAFDNPDALPDHMQWLKNAGFETFNFKVYGNYWTHFKAYKA